MPRRSTIRSAFAALLTWGALTWSGEVEVVSAAGSTSSSFQVGARVNTRCMILTSDIAFPSTYTSGQVAPLDAVGSVFVDCDRGRRASVRLDEGQNADPSSTPRNPLRRMRLGTAYLSYNLYEDPAHTRVWDDDRPGVKTVRLWPVLLPVYARIDGGQTVTAYDGAYTDSVVASLFW